MTNAQSNPMQCTKAHTKTRLLLMSLCFILMATLSVPLPGQVEQGTSGPKSTSVPVLFLHGLLAGKTKVGDPIIAETMQVVHLKDGQLVPKGTKIFGHVVASTPLQRGSGTPSTLAFQFDSLELHGATVPLKEVALRALASPVDVTDASTPQYLDDKDRIGTFTLVGGDLYLRTDTKVMTPGSRIVGTNDQTGVHAVLQLGSADGLHCRSSRSIQAVGIFSPSACGLYGYETVSVAPSLEGHGAIALQSSKEAIRVYPYSAALLELKLPQQ